MTTELRSPRACASTRAYISPYFAQPTTERMEAIPRGALTNHPAHRQEDRSGAGSRACARADCPHRQAPADHRRRTSQKEALATLVVKPPCRGVLNVAAVKAPGVRLIAARHARRHRRSHQWSADHRRTRSQAGEHQAGDARHCPPHHHQQRQHTIVADGNEVAVKARVEQIASRSTKPTPPTTRGSSRKRSGQASPVVWPW